MYKYFIVTTTLTDRYHSSFANEETEAREMCLYICGLHSPTHPPAPPSPFEPLFITNGPTSTLLQ